MHHENTLPSKRPTCRQGEPLLATTCTSRRPHASRGPGSWGRACTWVCESQVVAAMALVTMALAVKALAANATGSSKRGPLRVWQPVPKCPQYDEQRLAILVPLGRSLWAHNQQPRWANFGVGCCSPIFQTRTTQSASIGGLESGCQQQSCANMASLCWPCWRSF